MSLKLITLCLLAAIMAGACAPGRSKVEPTGINLSGEAVILPVKSTRPMPGGRLEYLRKAMVREFSSSGYAVLPTSLVDRLCGSPECTDLEPIIAKYPDANLFAVTLDSQPRANFLAAYYNALAGTIKVTAPGGMLSETYPFKVSDKGGLVFNSGQLFEGLSSTVTAFSTDPFNSLADSVAVELAAKFPRPSGQQAAIPAANPSIAKVKTSNVGFVTRVCASGSPGKKAEMMVGRLSVPMKEVKPGEYCGQIPTQTYEAPDLQKALVLRTDFGLQDQRSLMAAVPQCKPEEIIARHGKTLAVKCGDNCRPPCPGSRLQVYKSRGSGAPFIKSGVISGREWTDPEGKVSDDYAVITVRGPGVVSMPAFFKGEK